MDERESRSAARMRRPISVQYSVPGVFGWRVGRLSDFGWEGARLQGAEPLEPGMAVQLRLVMPGSEGLEVLDASVIWARTLRGAPPQHQHGLAFTSDAAKVRETINAAIRYVLKTAKTDSEAPDRRRSSRVKASWEAAYHEVAHESAGWRPAGIVDLSVHGAQFKSTELLKSGETIEMRLASPEGGQPIVMRGRIVWSQVLPDSRLRYGLEFLSPATGQEARFEAFVQWLNIA